MLTVKEVLDKLDEEKKTQLMVAFEAGVAQIVDVDDETFIGVNVNYTSDFRIIDEAGFWIIGKRMKS